MTATLKDVDSDIATHVAALVSGLTLNTNLFVGREVPPDGSAIPEEAVFCFEISTPEVDPVMNGGSASGQSHVTVGQFRLRGAKNAGTTSVKAIGVAIIQDTHFVIPTGYVEFRCLMGQPERIEPDSDGRERFVINWSAEYEEA